MGKLIIDKDRVAFITDVGEVYVRSSQRRYEEDEVKELMNELRKLENEPTGKKPGRKELQS
jgi:hypothetical protein